jgi:hypothetical protein
MTAATGRDRSTATVNIAMTSPPPATLGKSP